MSMKIMKVSGKVLHAHLRVANGAFILPIPDFKAKSPIDWEAKKIRKMFIPYIMVIAMATIIPSQKSWAQADGFSMGGFAANQLAEYLRHMEESRRQCDESSRQVSVARSNYQAALASGSGVEAARSELYQLLDAKDFLYIGIYVLTGRNSPQTKNILENCVIDGGIRPYVSKAFFDLVKEVRTRMGARGENDILFLNPSKLVAAIEAELPRANAYVHARNLMEIYESGVPTEQLFSAEAYLKILLEMEFSRPSLNVLQPGMDSLPQERFDLAVEVFGKRLVMQAAETVLKLPKSKNGELAREFSTDEVHGTADIFQAFNEILKTETKGFVIFSRYAYYRNDWAGEIIKGSKYYDELINLHGKDKVHEVVESLRVAPRIFDGKIGLPHDGGYKTETDLWHLEELLTNPEARIVGVEDFVFLAASDTEAIIESKGKIQIIYGRINDVRLGGGNTNDAWNIKTFYVYFAGVSKFGLWFTDKSFWKSRTKYGNDAKGLIGKLIRVDGFVNQSVNQKKRSILPDWTMRVVDGSYRIIAEEDWPDYLPIPEMQPARSLEELRAAVTPIEGESEWDMKKLNEESLAARENARAEAVKKYPGALNCHPIESTHKPAFGSSVSSTLTRYLYQIATYTKAVALYETYSEVCSGVVNSAIRGDFLQAALGGLDAENTVIFDSHVEIEYQSVCPGLVGYPCGNYFLDRYKSSYEEVMTLLNSGDLQSERDLLMAHEDANRPKPRAKPSRSAQDLPGAVVKSELSRSWKRYAKSVGKYAALSEACSGELEPAIRAGFLAELGSASSEQMTELKVMIDGSYEKQREARQKSRNLCNKSQLKKEQTKYQKMITVLKNGTDNLTQSDE